jgi:unsaturated rhamnogalacturonyl hydrolase
MFKTTAKILTVCALMANSAFAQVQQSLPWSERMANTMLTVHKDTITYSAEKKNAHWEYEMGLMMKSLENVWYHTGDAKYFRYIKQVVDQFVDDKGNIRTYKLDDYNLDMITPGRLLLTLYHETSKEKYRLAADNLMKQLHEQPRTKEGGFWHKKRYPNQMWLDGLYMAEPFMQNIQRCLVLQKTLMILLISLFGWKKIVVTIKQVCYIMDGTKAASRSGLTPKLVSLPTSGVVQWAGTQWLW